MLAGIFSEIILTHLNVNLPFWDHKFTPIFHIGPELFFHTLQTTKMYAFFQQETPRDHKAKQFQQLQNMESKILILIAVA